MALDVDKFHVHPLADTLVVHLCHVSQLGIHLGGIHVGADGNGEQVLVHQGLLMTEQHGLAAQLQVITDGNGLHGRCSLLVEHCLCVVREIRALVDGHCALSHLHAECHTGGVAALLTVLLRRQLKNVKTF